MEVEVKIRLPSKIHYEKVSSIFKEQLKAQWLATELQENFFFDSENDLLRIESFDRIEESKESKRKNFAALKGNAIIADGISRTEEFECEIDNMLTNMIINDPSKIASEEANRHLIIAELLKRFPSIRSNSESLRILGSFKNTRERFEWDGLKVELDETKYDFGDAFEIEIECQEPEKVHAKLSNLLSNNNVEFCNSKRNKFANMLFRSIL
ncbi:hypothetical protein HK096_008791 [Nowakowskiella sp. JEL0078]|nr:hypothetical protein HK096_008791 [Nowakowskiella sp. JEL0078]